MVTVKIQTGCRNMLVVQSLWTRLWGRYDVLQNGYLVLINILCSTVQQTALVTGHLLSFPVELYQCDCMLGTDCTVIRITESRR